MDNSPLKPSLHRNASFADKLSSINSSSLSSGTSPSTSTISVPSTPPAPLTPSHIHTIPSRSSTPDFYNAQKTQFAQPEQTYSPTIVLPHANTSRYKNSHPPHHSTPTSEQVLLFEQEKLQLKREREQFARDKTELEAQRKTFSELCLTYTLQSQSVIHSQQSLIQGQQVLAKEKDDFYKEKQTYEQKSKEPEEKIEVKTKEHRSNSDSDSSLTLNSQSKSCCARVTQWCYSRKQNNTTGHTEKRSVLRPSSRKGGYASVPTQQ